MQSPKRNIVEAGKRRNILPYVLGGAAAAIGLAAYLAVRTLTGGGEGAPNYPIDNKPAVTVEAQPNATLPQIYFSDDRLASIDCGGCSQEEAQPYLDQVHRQAVAERAQFNGIVSDAYEYVDGKLVKKGGKKLLRTAEGNDGLVRVELECPPCDSETLKALTAKAEGAYDFIITAMQPSRKPGLYVTVSQDGRRANVTYHNDRDHIATLRQSQTAFYPWHITDDFSQMTYEIAVKIDATLGYSGEGFLSDFWGNSMQWRRLGKIPDRKIGDYSKDRSQAGLGQEVHIALTMEGFDDSKFRQLAQRLESKYATWEQFKAEADAVAGRHLTTLDLIDQSVRLWRTQR